MSGSTDAATATPAWKKLGLKLKHSNADGPVGQPDRAQGSVMQGKRKHAAGAAASDYSSPQSAKKPRRDFTHPSTGDATPQLRKKKSVAFADTPSNKTAAPGSTTARKTPAKPLPKHANSKSPVPKKQKKKQQQQTTTDTKPALEYLRHWVSSRDSWKFNKNHQSTLIKAVFDTGLPPADVGHFYDYIDDIKGAVRMRLRETALAIRLKDGADRAAVFPKGTPDAEGKQEIYEAAIAGFLEAQHAAADPRKRTFAEMEYVTTAQDADVIIRRVVKRMRAEMVIATLSDGDETDVGATSAVPRAAKAAVAAAVAADQKPNGITGKRRRKLRTNMDDSSSSESSDSSDSDSSDSDSDSDSDSGSDTSSSGSDSSDDEADEDENMDDDSSSSSSSSSDDDSDDEDSDDEATSAKGEKKK